MALVEYLVTAVVFTFLMLIITLGSAALVMTWNDPYMKESYLDGR